MQLTCLGKPYTAATPVVEVTETHENATAINLKREISVAAESRI